MEIAVHFRIKSFIGLIIILSTNLIPSPAYAGKPVVRAVLFFSPSCSHCLEVMEEVLPPLVDKYKDQLDIVGINVTQQLGLELFDATMIRYKVPDNRAVFPALVVGDTILVGSYEIPQKFPRIIEEGLASGGIDWPDIPGLQQVLSAQSITLEDNTQIEQNDSDGSVLIENFLKDPVANSIALIVLLGMLICVFVVSYSYIKGSDSKFIQWHKGIIPLLSIVGLGVASYLSYVEITSSVAVCGPVGNCNSVQQSPYAHLFGIIPIGILGIAGYVAILASWLFREYGHPYWYKYCTLAIWGMAWFGVLFSIYLTFLEPFVIGATCAWCITSAIIMTLILLASTNSAKRALEIREVDIGTEEVDEVVFENQDILHLESEGENTDGTTNTLQGEDI